MKRKRFAQLIPVLLLSLLLNLSSVGRVHAQAIGSSDPEQSGTTGLQGTIPSPPPTTPATIATPVDGRTFTESPITINGLCTTDLLVKIFSNNIFVGSAQCTNGSYELQIDLFSGGNEIVAVVYDSLDQAGPESNSVTINYQDATFAAFGQRVSLSSTVAKLGAAVGSKLTWPIVLSGGTGPYAISVDWGDGSAAALQSQPFAGTFNITHVYKSAGVYRVVVKATDSTGATAFLQLVGVGNGEVTQTNSGSATSDDAGAGTIQYIYVWWPILLMLPIVLAMFWVGKRYELVAIHRQIEKQSKMYDNEIQR